MHLYHSHKENKPSCSTRPPRFFQSKTGPSRWSFTELLRIWPRCALEAPLLWRRWCKGRPPSPPPRPVPAPIPEASKGSSKAFPCLSMPGVRDITRSPASPPCPPPAGISPLVPPSPSAFAGGSGKRNDEAWLPKSCIEGLSIRQFATTTSRQAPIARCMMMNWAHCPTRATRVSRQKPLSVSGYLFLATKKRSCRFAPPACVVSVSRKCVQPASVQKPYRW